MRPLSPSASTPHVDDDKHTAHYPLARPRRGSVTCAPPPLRGRRAPSCRRCCAGRGNSSAKGCTQGSGRFGGRKPQDHAAGRVAELPRGAYTLLERGDAKGCTHESRRMREREPQNDAAERCRGAAESAYTLLERVPQKGVRTLVHDCGGLATNSRACACAEPW